MTEQQTNEHLSRLCGVRNAAANAKDDGFRETAKVIAERLERAYQRAAGNTPTVDEKLGALR
jgi:hypothetical protein